jgi:hypothetical protein
MIGCEVTRSIGCLTLLAVAFHLSGSFVPDSPLSETPEKHAKKKKRDAQAQSRIHNHNIIAQNLRHGILPRDQFSGAKAVHHTNNVCDTDLGDIDLTPPNRQH